MVPAVVPSVGIFTKAFKDLILKASEAQDDRHTNPPLDKSIFGDRIDDFWEVSGRRIVPTLQSQYAAIETASRNILYDLIATTPIDDPAFNQVWNLLDIVTLIADADQCEPGLPFWLVEELLDSQTINGCRTVFGYLESRRERMCAKRFSKKSLIILRACNELLRRLSRAEDTFFCGRVFIYLFQSAPLGDRSSVNLRGEYHTENVTTFDQPFGAPEASQTDSMEVDNKAEAENTSQSQAAGGEGLAENAVMEIANKSDDSKSFIKAAVQPGTAESAEPDLDRFYTEFWSMQQDFAAPTRLFEDGNFTKFKRGMSSTMQRFRSVDQGSQARSTNSALETFQRGQKRKRSDGLSNSFNPKYLTSRDLFELEISDLAFRRHILVQALILIDFLLSLTPKGRKKFVGKNNKAVLYNYVLSDEDAQWAKEMRSDIATYLQQGPEGKFYYRMVDTVLSRDKNWTQWKIDGCPPIQRDPVSTTDFIEARKGAQKACAPRRLKANPLGSVSLHFLSDTEGRDGLRKLTEPERYSMPTVESFKGPIAEDDCDIEMAKDEAERQRLKDARASKVWRTLRIASRSKFKLFDKIEDGNNLDVLFKHRADDSHATAERNGAEVSEQDASLLNLEQVVPADDIVLEIPQ